MNSLLFFSILGKKILTAIAIGANRYSLFGGVLMFLIILIKLFLFLYSTETLFISFFFSLLVSSIAGALFSALIYVLSFFLKFIINHQVNRK